MTETANNPTEPNPPAVTAPAAATPPVEAVTTQPAADDGKTLLADDSKGEPKPTEPKPAEAAKPEGAPEKYEFKAPEGKAYDATLLTSFSDAAKEANLSQDAAQKLLEKMAPTLQARQAEQVEAIQKQWVDTSTADKEFGGEALKQNMGVAKKALDSFGTPELRKLLEDTGLGNHPEVIRFMYRTGKAISEDTFVSGKGSAVQNPEAVFFPTMNKK